jgi:pimeloyl-ACP methyl ester carboxylesterase
MMSVARIQQTTGLVLIGLALAWFAAWAAQGQWVIAALALLAGLPHGPALAFEMLWAAHLARDEAARRAMGSEGAPPETYPGKRVWLRAACHEAALAVRVFGWQQPWAHGAQPDHLPANSQGRRGVLLVHGFFCNRGFWNPWMARLREAGIPFIAVTLDPPVADIALQARALARARLQLLEATGFEPLMVGHSMGGLVIRSHLAGQSDELAVRCEAITIGSPHHGTVLARLGLSTAALQMRPGSDFLRDLTRRESAERLRRLTCYWSVCDNIVFPARHATLAGARNIAVPNRPHVGLADAPEIFEDVLGRLSSLQAGQKRS